MADDHLWAAVEAADLGTLATIKKDGRPQLSDVNYTASPGLLRVSTRAELAKVHNLRRDPRGSFRIAPPSGGGYVVAEVTAEFSPPSAFYTNLAAWPSTDAGSCPLMVIFTAEAVGAPGNSTLKSNLAPARISARFRG